MCTIILVGALYILVPAICLLLCALAAHMLAFTPSVSEEECGYLEQAERYIAQARHAYAACATSAGYARTYWAEMHVYYIERARMMWALSAWCERR